MPTDPNSYNGISAQPDAGGMRHLNALLEEESWEDGIYQIESGDAFCGGPKGLANLQAQQLANRTAWLKKNGCDKKSFRQLEHIVNNLIASFEITSIAPDGYDGMLVENFDDMETEIDMARYDVLSIAEDKLSMVVGASRILDGGFYQIGDGHCTEEFQVKSSAPSSTGFITVTLESPLKEDYGENAKVARTSMSIGEGCAKVDESSVFKSSKAVCVTRYYDLPRVIHTVHLNLKHTPEKDVKYEAFVSFTEDGKPEVWKKMTQDIVHPNKIDKSCVDDQFDYEATDMNGLPSGKHVAIRVEITQGSGIEQDSFLGVGSGASTKYLLPHHASKDTIRIVPAEAEWTYDDTTDTLDITAPAGSHILASYDWASKTTLLKSMACIFND